MHNIIATVFNQYLLSSKLCEDKNNLHYQNSQRMYHVVSLV